MVVVVMSGCDVFRNECDFSLDLLLSTLDHIRMLVDASFVSSCCYLTHC